MPPHERARSCSAMRAPGADGSRDTAPLLDSDSMTRPFDPRFRIKSQHAAALFITMAPVLYFLPAILSGRVLCPADGLMQHVPFRATFAQMLRTGHLPLWDPYIFGGMPFLAAAQPGV